MNAHNAKMLKLLVKGIINIEAVDSKTDSQTQSLSTTNFSKFTTGLPGILQIGQGARVMLIKNLNVDDGPVPHDETTQFIPKYIY